MKYIADKLKNLAFTSLALFFSVMCLFTLLLRSSSTPLPQILPQKPLLIICLAALDFMGILGIYRIGLLLSRFNRKKLVVTILTMYFAVQVLFIVMFPVNAYEDAAIVEGFAKEILHGKYSSLGVGNYLGYYPNNIGITMFFTFLYGFLPNNLLTLRFCNVIFTTLSAWLIYKLYGEFFTESGNKACGVLLLAVCFLPALILDNLTYGDIISTSLCLAGLLNAVRFVKSSLMKYAVYTSLFLMLGNFIRSVALLFLFAILLYWAFNSSLFRSSIAWKRVLAGAVITILAFSMPLKIFSFVGLKSGIIEEPVGLHSNPVWRWINIGFPSDSKLGYWDGGRNTTIFISRYKCNPKLASRFFIYDLLNKYQNMGRINTLKCYIKKTFWIWTEGTYNVNFYGLSQELEPEKFKLYDTPLIRYAEPGDKVVRASIDWFLHAYNWVTLLLTAFYLGSCVIKKDFRLELLVYTLFFYLGFYFFWEVKSRYLFGLYPVFLMMSYTAAGEIYEKYRFWHMKKTALKQD